MNSKISFKSVVTSVFAILFLCQLLFVPSYSLDMKYEMPLFLEYERIDSQVHPMLDNGELFVPLELIADAIGYSYEYVNDSIVVHGKHGDIVFTDGSPNVTVFGKEITLYRAPFRKNNVFYIPYKSLSDMLGLNVYYNDTPSYIQLTDPTLLPPRSEMIGYIYSYQGKYAFFLGTNGKYGLVSDLEQIVFPAKWEAVVPEISDGYICYQQDGKWGAISVDGREVLAPEWDSLSAFRHGAVVVGKIYHGEMLYGLADEYGRVVFNPREGTIKHSNGYFISSYKDDDGIGHSIVLTNEGRSILSGEYDDIDTWADGIFRVMQLKRVNGRMTPRYGLIRNDGTFILDIEYPRIDDVDASGYAVFSDGRKEGVVNRLGRKLCSPKYDRILLPYSGPYVVVRNSDNYGYLDNYGKVVVELKYADALPFQNNYFTVLEKPAYGHSYRWLKLGVNQEAVKELDEVVDLAHKKAEKDTLSIVQTEEGYELQNKDGVNVLEMPYKKIEPLGRYFKVRGDGGVGIYGPEGLIVLFAYEDVSLYDATDLTSEIFVLETKSGTIFITASGEVLLKH